MVFLLLILIIIFSIVLIKSADITVIALKKISGRVGIVGLSAVLVAIGTSLPELFVGITSAIAGKTALSLGVALGSNIANIALIGAGAALIAGRVNIPENIIKKIVWVSFACGILPYLLLIDGNLTRIDGIILVLVYLSYIFSFFNHYHQRAVEEHEKGLSFTKYLRKVEHFAEDKWKSFVGVGIGISLMLFSADTIVKFSSLLAERISISIFVIGLFILAIGTSLPEFAFSLRSLKDKEPEMFIGNLMGSIVANTTLIIGISVLINPIKAVLPMKYLAPGLVFIFVYLLFYFFIRTKKRLDRWEAGVLLAIYVIFFLVELI